ncbi:DUF3761 domain-containing protein [Streptomyces puniciscabiei]
MRCALHGRTPRSRLRYAGAVGAASAAVHADGGAPAAGRPAALRQGRSRLGRPGPGTSPPNSPPKDKYETAKCQDATLSYSRHPQGTCSHHHGVRYWFK